MTLGAACQFSPFGTVPEWMRQAGDSIGEQANILFNQNRFDNHPLLPLHIGVGHKIGHTPSLDVFSVTRKLLKIMVSAVGIEPSTY